MAESIVPFRKKIKDSLTRQGMWNTRGLYRKGLAEREEKERVPLSERAHRQVLTVKKNMHLILDSSTVSRRETASCAASKLDSTANVVCGLAADSDSVHQADNRLPAMRLKSL